MARISDEHPLRSTTMFNRKALKRPSRNLLAHPFVGFEPLEDRVLLSASHHGAFGGGFGGGGHGGNTVLFSQLDTQIQMGLTGLASADSVAAPSASSTVYLGNSRGVETYTYDVTSTGTDTKLTVDSSGNPLTAPTQSTTPFSTIASAAAGTEIDNIATALNLTAPATTDTVYVSTPTVGAAVYTVYLNGSSSSGHHFRGEAVTVDANGNPVGNEVLPFSALPTGIQGAVNANVPSGATALDPTSTQNVVVRTTDGITTYSTTFTSSGTKSTVTVDAGGNLTNLPSHSTTTYSGLQTSAPAAAAELSTLATADGVSTIASTQTIQVYTETNGTVVYSVHLPATGTRSNGNTFTYTITLSSDQAGNPTVPPTDGGGFGGFGFGGFEFGGFGFGDGGFGGGDCGGQRSGGTTTPTPTPTPTATATVRSGVRHATRG
jgi:hypothetical protein